MYIILCPALSGCPTVVEVSQLRAATVVGMCTEWALSLAVQTSGLDVVMVTMYLIEQKNISGMYAASA